MVIRARRVLGLAAAVAFCGGCGGGSGSPAPTPAKSLPSACDAKGLAKGMAQVQAKRSGWSPDSGDPPWLSTSEVAGDALRGFCQLPPRIATLVDFHRVPRAAASGETKPSFEDVEEYEALFTASCAGGRDVLTSLRDAPANQQTSILYDRCDYGRLDLIPREAFIATSTRELPFVTATWLEQHAVSAPVVKALASAIAVPATAVDFWGRWPRGLRLPTMGSSRPASWSPSTLGVAVTQRSVLVGDQMVAPVTDGRIDDPAIASLTKVMGKRLGATGSPPAVLIAVERGLPVASMAAVSGAIHEAGFRDVALMTLRTFDVPQGRWPLPTGPAADSAAGSAADSAADSAVEVIVSASEIRIGDRVVPWASGAGVPAMPEDLDFKAGHVVLRSEPDVTVARLVTVADALAGPRCWLDAAGEPTRPGDCAGFRSSFAGLVAL